MAIWLQQFHKWITGQIECSNEAPPPSQPPLPPTDTSKDDKKEKEPPIIFDELENPALAERSKQHPMRPPTTEQLLQPLRMTTYVDFFEGARVDFGMGLSPRMQVTNSWVLNQGNTGSYDVTFMFAGGKLSSPYDMVTPSPFLMGRFNPAEGKQDLRLMYRLADNLEFKMQSQYMSYNPLESQIQLEMEYQGQDFVSSFKFSPAFEVVALSYMQSLTHRTVSGLEVVNLTKPRQMTGLNLFARHQTSDVGYYASYMSMQQMLHLGTVIKGNPNINFTTELVWSFLPGEGDFTAGMSVRFQRAKFNTQMNMSGRLLTSLMHALNPFMKLNFCAEVDFVKQTQKFGIGVNIGNA